MNNAEQLKMLNKKIEENKAQLEKTIKRRKQINMAGRHQEHIQLGRFMGRLLRKCTDEEFDKLQDLALKYAIKRDPVLDIFDQFSNGRV